MIPIEALIVMIPLGLISGMAVGSWLSSLLNNYIRKQRDEWRDIVIKINNSRYKTLDEYMLKPPQPPSPTTRHNW